MKSEHRQQRDTYDRDEIIALEALARDDVGEIDAQPDEHRDGKLGDPHGSGQDDRGIAGDRWLRRDHCGGGRKRSRMDLRRCVIRRCGGGRSRTDYRSRVKLQHGKAKTKRSRRKAGSDAPSSGVPKKGQEMLRLIG